MKFPLNFRLDGGYFVFNNETRQLEPYKNITVSQYVDSNGNRQKVLINQTLPTLGYTYIESYLDCSTGMVTQHIPSLNYCVQQSLGRSYNLTDIMTKARDPTSGES